MVGGFVFDTVTLSSISPTTLPTLSLGDESHFQIICMFTVSRHILPSATGAYLKMKTTIFIL